MAEKEVGRITHYFTNLGVAAVEVTSDSLDVGDTIHIHGHSSDFIQRVDSMQLEGHPIEHAHIGQAVGIKVADNARVHDVVYKVGG